MADVEAGYLPSEAAATLGLRRLSSMSEAPLPENTGSPPQEGTAQAMRRPAWPRRSPR